VDTSACQTLSAGKIEHFFGAVLDDGDDDGDRDGEEDGDDPADGAGGAAPGSAVAVDLPAEHDDSNTTTAKPTRIRRTPEILRLEALAGTRVVHRDRLDRTGRCHIEQDLVGVDLGGHGVRSTVFTPYKVRRSRA
jgi:hypothetical protein